MSDTVSFSVTFSVFWTRGMPTSTHGLVQQSLWMIPNDTYVIYFVIQYVPLGHDATSDMLMMSQWWWMKASRRQGWYCSLCFLSVDLYPSRPVWQHHDLTWWHQGCMMQPGDDVRRISASAGGIFRCHWLLWLSVLVLPVLKFVLKEDKPIKVSWKWDKPTRIDGFGDQCSSLSAQANSDWGKALCVGGLHSYF